MRSIIASIGSDGDLLPMLGVATTLQAQGNDVSVLCGDWQLATVEKHGLCGHSILSKSQFDAFTTRAANNENEWIAFFLEAVLPGTLPTFDYVVNHCTQDTLLIGSCHTLGLKLAQEKLAQNNQRVHWLATHLQPPADADPGSESQVFFDRLAGSKVNIIRRRLELAPLSTPFNQWMMSCETAALFYPDWFSPYNNSQTKTYIHAGFPFIDSKNHADELPGSLDLLLAQDQAPIVFTYGTGNSHAREFFQLAVKACEIVGLPAIFLCKQRELLPEKLPPHTLWLDFIPLGQLMPYTNLIVHHGGIGTCAQAFKAGIPQIILPVGFDQFQNAARVQELSLGASFALQSVSAPQLARKIQALINSPQTEQECRRIATSFSDADALKIACQFIQELVK